MCLARAHRGWKNCYPALDPSAPTSLSQNLSTQRSSQPSCTLTFPMIDTNDSSKAPLLPPDPSPTANSPTGDKTVPSSSNSLGAKNSRARHHTSRGRGGSGSSCSKRKKEDQGRTAYKYVRVGLPRGGCP